MSAQPSRQPRAVTGARRPGRRAELADNAGVLGDIVQLVWQRKLWWMIPLLVAILLLAVLIFVQATPVGPLLYPVF